MLLLWILLFSIQFSFAQNSISNLYFNSTSNILKLSFNNSSPSISYTKIGSGAGIGEGIAHAEDHQGNVIIWVNASGVYDKDGKLMPGSSGILAHPSSTEIVICPFPDDPRKFYIFYNNQLCSQLYYAVVDMDLREGKGDVVNLNFDLEKGNTFAEGLEIIKIPCTEDFWLMAYECYVGFKKFRISREGISSGEIIQEFDAGGHHGRGELDYHNGRLGYAVTYKNKAFLADFDPGSGTMSNPQIINLNATNGIYGLEFSPDASKVYFSDWNNKDFFGNIASPNLFRYDFRTQGITSWNIAFDDSNCSGAEIEGLGQIELGKDGNLYIPHVGGCEITVVENPDHDQPIFNQLPVNTILSAGISDPIQSEIISPLQVTASQTTICLGEFAEIKASGGSGAYSWSSSANFATSDEAIIEVQPKVNTRYTVFSPNLYGCQDSSSITIQVNEIIKPIISVAEATCGGSFNLNASSVSEEFTWYRNQQIIKVEPAGEITVFEDGYYQVEVHGLCSVLSDEIFIKPTLFEEKKLFVPNVFTPDDDPLQANEAFEIKNFTGEISLAIYNRWGKEVFRSNNYKNDWKGEGLASGVYFYKIQHRENCFAEVKGYVQILK